MFLTAEKLELFVSSKCPYCTKVMKKVDSCHLYDQMVIYDVGKSKEARNRLQTIGGKMMVPCLFIDGKPMYESDDIIAWLDQHFACNKKSSS